jgi:ribosome maturation factor RimP
LVVLDLEQSLTRLADPLLAEMGLMLVDLEQLRQGGRLLVRMFVDRTDRSHGGVTINECGEFNLALSRALEAAALIPDSYMLEVSSPGLNRRLRRIEHFRAAVGEAVQVVLKEKINDRRTFHGRLQAADGGRITVLEDGQEYELPLEGIERANVVFDFTGGKTGPRGHKSAG